jgi:hypothetical protein
MLILKKIASRLLRLFPRSHYPYKAFMHKKKCIFIHIPKNAGSSVLASFEDKGGRKHAKWYDFYEANDYFYKKYHKFAIVRAPLPRLYSAYNYAVAGGNQSKMDLALKKQIDDGSRSFEDFIHNVLCYDFVMQQPLFLPQYLYVFDRQLNSCVDSLLHYENLFADWQKLALLLSLPKALPWKNSSNVSELPVLSEQSLTKVSAIYHFDYQLLGYKKVLTIGNNDTLKVNANS